EFLYMAQHRIVPNEFIFKKGTDCFFCHIILCGSEPPCYDDNGRTVARFPKSFRDMIPIVLNGSNLIYGYTYFIEFLGYESRVGIHNLPDEDFIPNGDDLGLHL